MSTSYRKLLNNLKGSVKECYNKHKFHVYIENFDNICCHFLKKFIIQSEQFRQLCQSYLRK